MGEVLNKKIIIAEDADYARLLELSKLKKHGFTSIATPASGAEAWQLIAESSLDDEPYDLLITDLNMPDIDGMDLISKIKDDPLSPDIKIIVVSADADKFIQEICRDLGVDAYIVKPFNEENFIDIVTAVLKEEPIPELVPFFEGA